MQQREHYRNPAIEAIAAIADDLAALAGEQSDKGVALQLRKKSDKLRRNAQAVHIQLAALKLRPENGGSRKPDPRNVKFVPASRMQPTEDQWAQLEAEDPALASARQPLPQKREWFNEWD